MKQRNRILLAVVVVAVVGGLAWVGLREPPEPVYKGRRLSAWYQDMLNERTVLPNVPSTWSPFLAALDATGTNALPFLLDMLNRKEYSPLRTKFVNWANRHGNVFHHHFWTEEDGWWMEHYILDLLSSSKTKPPISGFLEILDKSKNTQAKCIIIASLPDLAVDPDTVKPAILKALKDDAPAVRVEATNALKTIDAMASGKAGAK